VEEKGVTVAQRSKEYAHDYRYFPEPDLPPLVLSRERVEEIRSRLPELPEARRDRFIAEYKLPAYDANLLTSSKAMADYFEECWRVNEKVPAKEVSNWILGEVSRITNEESIGLDEFGKRVSPEHLSGLILASHGAISVATAKSVLEEMFRTGKPSGEIIAQQGLAQISDTKQLEEIVKEVINSNAQAVADYKGGKKESLKFLVGQVMRATKGRANPALVNELLGKKLEEG
jgi:aspartyl-tRNA(Asn)/glutamyl-tRNA(Gln) amidotransferase subunit B